jgi:hypothetical protein
MYIVAELSWYLCSDVSFFSISRQGQLRIIRDNEGLMSDVTKLRIIRGISANYAESQ